MRAGDKVWFRGKHAKHFSILGHIELVVSDSFVQANEIDGEFGVRLCNGNFKWADSSQIRLKEA